MKNLVLTFILLLGVTASMTAQDITEQILKEAKTNSECPNAMECKWTKYTSNLITVDLADKSLIKDGQVQDDLQRRVGDELLPMPQREVQTFKLLKKEEIMEMNNPG